jgi:hypothetical protein
MLVHLDRSSSGGAAEDDIRNPMPQTEDFCPKNSGFGTVLFSRWAEAGSPLLPPLVLPLPLEQRWLTARACGRRGHSRAADSSGRVTPAHHELPLKSGQLPRGQQGHSAPQRRQEIQTLGRFRILMRTFYRPSCPQSFKALKWNEF